MKKSIVVLLCVLMLAIGATASSTVNAILGTDIKVNLEGKALSLKDAKGNQVYPLVFNGTTYLPVRAVAENLDLKVNWNSNTRTIELSKKFYRLNEWWEVPNEWKLKINSVTVTQERNELSGYTPNEVIIIDYTYENLGNSRFDGLLRIEPKIVTDENAKTGKSYFLNLEKKPRNVKIGEKQENAQIDFSLPIAGSKEVGIYFSEYGSPYLYNGEEYMDTHEALFIVPVNR